MPSWFSSLDHSSIMLPSAADAIRPWRTTALATSITRLWNTKLTGDGHLLPIFSTSQKSESLRVTDKTDGVQALPERYPTRPLPQELWSLLPV